jgi:hypothetical protein
MISSADPESSRPPRKFMAVAVAAGLLPWLGIVARLLTANLLRITFIGIILWVAGCASLWYMHLPPEVARERRFGVSLLIWTLTFVPVFACTAMGTGMIISHF